VDHKVDALHSHWLNLKSLLESRIDLAVIYVKFHSLAVQLANEFDVAEEEFKKSPDGVNEDTIRLVEQKWLSIQQLYGQLTNVGKNFSEDASKVCSLITFLLNSVSCCSYIVNFYYVNTAARSNGQNY